MTELERLQKVNALLLRKLEEAVSIDKRQCELIKRQEELIEKLLGMVKEVANI